ncbi:MAG: hypothetical protein PF568_02070, partial [Deltaproteobacteria bacterium]|nr:hypothetical protein [Deltaproteobacteria bacterium]
ITATHTCLFLSGVLVLFMMPAFAYPDEGLPSAASALLIFFQPSNKWEDVKRDMCARAAKKNLEKREGNP